MFVLGIKKTKGIGMKRVVAIVLTIASVFAGFIYREPCAGADSALPSSYSQNLATPVAFTGTSAKAAVLMEADSGELIFSQNENARLPMASTTKIV